MVLEVTRRADAEQGVKQSGIAHVDLRSSDLPLAEVLEPRRQLPYHEEARHQVEVAAHRGFVDGERAGKLGGVPSLAVVVGHHVPEAAEGNGRNLDTQLRHVALQERLEELLPPCERIRLAARRVGKGKAATQPVLRLGAGAQVREAEALQGHGLQSSGQAFRRLAEELSRGAAENEKTGR